jgi:DNA-directed RNA polymerase specialized sigma24 family protein
VVLRYADGYALEEVAELVGASVSTVQRRLRSARARVAALEQAGGPRAILEEMEV